jgi:hypothetical protein
MTDNRQSWRVMLLNPSPKPFYISSRKIERTIRQLVSKNNVIFSSDEDEAHDEEEIMKKAPRERL